MSDINWLQIKNEYINGNISYRKLAEKYNVSFNTLQDIARRENWVEERKNQHDKITTKSRQKSAERIAEKEARRAERLNSAVDKLLEKIETATEQLNLMILSGKEKTRHLEYDSAGKLENEISVEQERRSAVESEYIDTARVKQIASALRDIKELTIDNNSADKADSDISLADMVMTAYREGKKNNEL